jgi:hypothetical protein
MEAVQLQAKRCEKAHEGPRDFVVDVAFYAVAVQRLREVARMASTGLVPRHYRNDGYSLRSFTRASSVVNFQLAPTAA